MFNSMEEKVYHLFMYHDNVFDLWTALQKMYSYSHNDARIFELYQEISHASKLLWVFLWQITLGTCRLVGKSSLSMSLLVIFLMMVMLSPNALAVDIHRY